MTAKQRFDIWPFSNNNQFHVCCIPGNEQVPSDMKKAFDYATKACDLRHPFACANLSQMYKKGDGTQKNMALADKFFKLANEIHEQHNKDFQQIKFGE